MDKAGAATAVKGHYGLRTCHRPRSALPIGNGEQIVLWMRDEIWRSTEPSGVSDLPWYAWGVASVK